MTSDRGQPAVALDPGGAMPLVGLGTWQMTGARCQAAVRAALEVGYRHIDTGAMYRAVAHEGDRRHDPAIGAGAGSR
jgi:diketogulonate reductase-like aldo/keto reductase